MTEKDNATKGLLSGIIYTITVFVSKTVPKLYIGYNPNCNNKKRT